MLGKEIVTRGLNASALARLLGGQRLATASGPTDFGQSFGSARTREYRDFRDRGEAMEKPRMGWLPLALLGALALLGLLFLLGRRREVRTEPKAVETVPPITQPAKPTVPTPAPPTTLWSAPETMGATGEALERYFADTTITGPRRFAMEGLNFETGSATLTGAAPANLASIAILLNAHPNAQIHVDGYTDNVGDPAQNRALSLSRAEAARDLLVQNGVDKSRISVSGNGEDRPIAANDTEEGRAKNRRIELVLTGR
jgi:outer membrane protein OmpA-like peptidoglycan-associated protein